MSLFIDRAESCGVASTERRDAEHLFSRDRTAMAACCVVIPCYNEESRLPVPAFLAFLQWAPDTRLLFVNDGSTDRTADILDQLVSQAPGRCAVLHLSRNGGKAEAVRQGLLVAAQQVSCVGFWDADLATALEVIADFERVLNRRGELQAVVGSRVPLAGHRIERSFFRRCLGSVFAILGAVLFPLGLRDTQCGAKLFRVTPAFLETLITPFQTRWLFDIELLLRLQASSGRSVRQTVYELPLDEWRDVAGSKLRRRDIVRIVKELMIIARSRPQMPVEPAPTILSLPKTSIAAGPSAATEQRKSA